MAENNTPLNDLELLTQDIISRFEMALNVSKTSELSSVVNEINGLLEKQSNLVQNISINSTERLTQTRNEAESVKFATEEIEKQSRLYQNILSSNDDITYNWDQMIKKSAMVGRNYKEINKQQKDYLNAVNIAIRKEKQLTDLTLKRINAVSKINKSGKKPISATSSKGGIPQFVDIQGLSSSQIALESMTGGKPYFASHPELGVPIGLFNTKDEPNRTARIRSIKKYGTQGSIQGLYPQYADDLPTISPNDPDADGQAATTLIVGKLVKKILEKQLNPLLDSIVEIVDVVKQLGDKFEEYAGESDEAIRSAIQSSGTLMAASWEKQFNGNTPLNRASTFAQSMEKAAWELNVDEGVFASYEMLSNLQKSFTQFSKTNVLLGKEDLKNMIYVQQTFDLAADDVAEIHSTFIDLGLSAIDMIEYTNELSKEARQYGVSATQLLKESAKLMKMGVQYRFKGGVSDFLKMQVYAANAKFDIENAYNVMDKSLSVEGAIDLAAQLQVLGGEFSDLSGLELFAAAQSGDMESFTRSIIDRFNRDVGRFGGIGKKGMFQFTPDGYKLLRAFEGIEGFDLGQNLTDVLTKAGKEQAIREKLLTSEANRSKFIKYSAEEQKKIVQNLAQGSIDILNISGQDLKNDVIDFEKYILGTATDMIIGPETAKGAQSIKDEGELNIQLSKMESQQLAAYDGLKEGLIRMKESLLYAGEAIFSIGKEYFSRPFFKKMEVLTDYLGVTLEEAILFHEYFEKASDGTNKYASMMKALMYCVENPGKCVTTGMFGNAAEISNENNRIADEMEKESGNPTVPSTIVRIPQTQAFQKYGGVLKAAGGVVMGDSHTLGGVRGTGSFNNVEVEGGEAIINKKSTSMFLPMLSKLNEIGGGTSFVDSSESSMFDNVKDNKTINIKISGGLNMQSKNKEGGSVSAFDMAEQIENLTSGKTYGGVY